MAFAKKPEEPALTSTALREDLQNLLQRQGTSDLALQAVAASVKLELEADAALVYTLDAGTGLLKLRCHPGISTADATGIRFHCIGKGLPGLAAARQEPIQSAFETTSMTPEERAVLPANSLFFPLIFDGRMRGVIGVARQADAPWAPETVSLLTGVARLIATYLK